MYPWKDWIRLTRKSTIKRLGEIDRKKWFGSVGYNKGVTGRCLAARISLVFATWILDEIRLQKWTIIEFAKSSYSNHSSLGIRIFIFESYIGATGSGDMPIWLEVQSLRCFVWVDKASRIRILSDDNEIKRQTCQASFLNLITQQFRSRV